MEERDVQIAVSDREVDALVAAFNGNAREALRAAMHDLSVLADHFNATTSRGFARRQQMVSVAWGQRGGKRAKSRIIQPNLDFA